MLSLLVQSDIEAHPARSACLRVNAALTRDNRLAMSQQDVER
jgi:hypothetical protein